MDTKVLSIVSAGTETHFVAVVEDEHEGDRTAADYADGFPGSTCEEDEVIGDRY